MGKSYLSVRPTVDPFAWRDCKKRSRKTAASLQIWSPTSTFIRRAILARQALPLLYPPESRSLCRRLQSRIMKQARQWIASIFLRCNISRTTRKSIFATSFWSRLRFCRGVVLWLSSFIVCKKMLGSWFVGLALHIVSFLFMTLGVEQSYLASWSSWPFLLKTTYSKLGMLVGSLFLSGGLWLTWGLAGITILQLARSLPDSDCLLTPNGNAR